MQKKVIPTAVPMVAALVPPLPLLDEEDCSLAAALAFEREGLLVGEGMVGRGVGL